MDSVCFIVRIKIIMIMKIKDSKGDDIICNDNDSNDVNEDVDYVKNEDSDDLDDNDDLLKIMIAVYSN